MKSNNFTIDTNKNMSYNVIICVLYGSWIYSDSKGMFILCSFVYLYVKQFAFLQPHNWARLQEDPNSNLWLILRTHPDHHHPSKDKKFPLSRRKQVVLTCHNRNSFLYFTRIGIFVSSIMYKLNDKRLLQNLQFFFSIPQLF